MRFPNTARIMNLLAQILPSAQSERKSFALSVQKPVSPRPALPHAWKTRLTEQEAPVRRAHTSTLTQQKLARASTCIPIRMRLVPAPGVFDYNPNIAFVGTPAQHLSRFFG